MNATIEKFAREQILAGLQKLSSGQQNTFRRMHSHLDLTKPLDSIVASMPTDKLDWALTQIENTLKK